MIIHVAIQLCKRDINKLHVSISYKTAWTALTKALAIIFGDWEKSHQTLPQYLEAIVENNPGTVYKITIDDPYTDGTAKFTGVFLSFGPSIEGFYHCRPVLSVDGTHLDGKYGGVL